MDVTFSKACRQIIAVEGKSDSIQAAVRLYRREGPAFPWRLEAVMPAVIGRNGMTADKKEGDGKTPVGFFKPGIGFGMMPPPPGTLWPYRQVGQYDYWVDDPASPEYNRWVHYEGDPHKRWKSFERLAIPAYAQALVIRYNEDPVEPGRGSAIFFHRWKRPDLPSAGCITVSAENVSRVLSWLRQEAKPVFAIGIEGDPGLSFHIRS